MRSIRKYTISYNSENYKIDGAHFELKQSLPQLSELQPMFMLCELEN